MNRRVRSELELAAPGIQKNRCTTISNAEATLAKDSIDGSGTNSVATSGWTVGVDVHEAALAEYWVQSTPIFPDAFPRTPTFATIGKSMPRKSAREAIGLPLVLDVTFYSEICCVMIPWHGMLRTGEPSVGPSCKQASANFRGRLSAIQFGVVSRPWDPGLVLCSVRRWRSPSWRDGRGCGFRTCRNVASGLSGRECR